MTDETTIGTGDPAKPDDSAATARARADAVTEPASRRDRGIREILFKLPGSREQVPATEVTQSDLSQINATTVMLDRSGSEHITADRVSLDRSGSRTIDARSVQLDRSGVVALGADHAVLLHSSAVQVVSEEARVTDSSVIFLSSANANLDGSRVVFFGGSASGDIHPVITTRTAAIVAGIVALALALLTLLGRTASHRDSMSWRGGR